MKCKVKIKLNKDAINKLKHASETALERTAHAVLSDIVSRGVVPFDTGALESSGFVQKVNEMLYKIIFDTPYARRWYFNAPHPKTGNIAHFQKTKNPNAQDHWMDYYREGEGKQCVIDTYAKFLKEESGGLIK